MAEAGQTGSLVAEKADLQDRLLRRMAEFDNFRRRVEREKSEIREFATMETVRQVLPVLDDFERALKTETSDAEYAKGMELILQRFSAELEKLGLEPIPTEGQQFDPHIHHALEMRETSEAAEHTILAELQKGYNFRGKLLRPALVSVAVALLPPKSSGTSEQARLLRSSGRRPGRRRAGDQERLPQDGAPASSRPQSRQPGSRGAVQGSGRSLQRAQRLRETRHLRPFRPPGPPAPGRRQAASIPSTFSDFSDIFGDFFGFGDLFGGGSTRADRARSAARTCATTWRSVSRTPSAA